MPFIDLPPGAEILGAMITPAVLMSAAGTLALATSNRLGRVVDRIRALSEAAEALTTAVPSPLAEEKRALIAALLNVLSRRMQLLQTAVSLLYIAIGIYVATSITLAAVIHLVIETRAAVSSTLVEVEFARRQVDRATQALEVSSAPPPMA